ncbi:MAG TPA: type I secretion system permease/ATPase [Burkholderiaceae bacterium]|nr:type I secretion system permease/ATPase [Burkholderiaceae bacterium]
MDPPRAPSPLSTMHWLLAAPLRRFVALAAFASLLLNLALLMPSLYTLQVFDRVFASRSIETLVMLSALTLLALAFGYCMDVVRAQALAAAGRAVMERLSPPALEQALLRGAGPGARADVERVRDVAQLNRFLHGSGVRALFDAPWLPIYLTVIALMQPWLGVTAAVGAVALAGIAVVTERVTRTRTDALTRLSRGLGRHADALVRHAEAFVGLGMVASAVAQWRRRHTHWLDEQDQLGASSARLSALARAARQGVQMAVLGVGALLVVGADASPGIMVAATILLGRALQPVEHLISGWQQLLDARGAWRRLCEPGSAVSKVPTLRLPAPSGRLSVERVVFGHDPLRPALIKGVSFTVGAGESLGLIGASGSGKTTLARLLLGLWVPRSGSVRLDAADIAQWNRDDLGAHVGYLPQDTSFFDATVAQSIARLGAVDDVQVIRAAQLAQAHDMILRLPQGYDTMLGDAGIALSGGQRQRIALARALYGQPKLVVLDEPDAHLDAEGEAALRVALQALKAQGTTVIVVGHRAALMAQLDTIAVLKDGTLQAIGPAATMLARWRARNVHPLPTVRVDAQEATA